MGRLAAPGRRVAGPATHHSRGSRRFVRGLAVTALVATSGGGLPGHGRAQDTVSAAKSAWIGIRFNEETREAPGPGEVSYALVVRDVYGNGPADRVGIRAGDWFVAVDGNPLSAYEAWLRSTSDLGPGQTLTVRLVRDSGEREVAVVAGRRPRSILPHPMYSLEMAMVRARFDSLFDLFLGAAPKAERWPGFNPHGESEALPPASRGGDGDLHGMYGTSVHALPAPTRQLLAGTVVLGGAVVRDLTAALGRYFGVDAGVLVTDVVDATTPAAQAGFRPGDIVVSVEGRQVANLLAFRRILAEEDPPIEITVVRRGRPLNLAYPSR